MKTATVYLSILLFGAVGCGRLGAKPLAKDHQHQTIQSSKITIKHKAHECRKF